MRRERRVSRAQGCSRDPRDRGLQLVRADRPPELREAYRYEAGQHLTFEFPWEGFKVTRCYSLSSCPDLGEPLKIGVKRVEGGRVSNWLNSDLTVGDTIRASVPEGRFVLDPETRSGAPLFLFAGGSGITPIISLLKSALTTTKRSITTGLRQPRPRFGHLRRRDRSSHR